MANGGVPLTAIAYQGLAGAFSEAAAAALFPGASLLPRRTFAEVFGALEAHEVDAAVVPVDALLELCALLVQWLLEFLEWCASLPGALASRFQQRSRTVAKRG